MNVFVIPQNGSWVVKRDDSEEVISEYDSIDSAIEAAKEIAMGQDAGLVILRTDGTIDNLGVYGVNMFPSEDNAPEFNNDEPDESV